MKTHTFTALKSKMTCTVSSRRMELLSASRSATKDIKMPASEESNATRPSTRTLGTSSCTMEIAESHGYEVVHGIVDSVWLRPKPNADPIEKVREHIAGSIGLPIELEGRYKWIVFLPCKTTGVGALNRYYGLFQDDEFKLRGIELRKHDTPEFINICQEAMLGELSLASTAAEFLERIPKAVDILRWTAKCVLDRTIPVHQFILTKSVSRALPEYVVLTATAAALKQMET